MSRADRLITRIEDALRGIKVETSEFFWQDFKESPFGTINLVTFLWRVAENDSEANSIALQVANRMTEKNICVTFHKTRRVNGERLITAAKPIHQDSRCNYSDLLEFTRSWLIESTRANEKPGQQKTAEEKNQQERKKRLRFRM